MHSHLLKGVQHNASLADGYAGGRTEADGGTTEGDRRACKMQRRRPREDASPGDIITRTKWCARRGGKSSPAAGLSVGETFILLHPPLPSAVVSIVMDKDASKMTELSPAAKAGRC